jgi:SlyX protein
MTEIEKLQETIAHLTQVTEDMSDVIARQDQELRDLTAKVTLLIEQEIDRMTASDGGVIVGNERPPHY